MMLLFSAGVIGCFGKIFFSPNSVSSTCFFWLVFNLFFTVEAFLKCLVTFEF